MKRQNSIRDGLSEWHYQYCRSLLLQLLAYGPINDDEYGWSPSLMRLLGQLLRVSEVKIADVTYILSVTRTHSGISFHKSQCGVPTELAINFGGLDRYETGAEFEEYASFAADPVIGNRWAQNVDEAILLILGHELAHYVVALETGSKKTKPHGKEFKAAYRAIRQCAVNPMLDEFAQDELQRTNARYEARLIKKIAALKKMSEDQTSNENEAERAVVQLEALLVKHGLTSSDMPIATKPHIVERTVPIFARDRYKPLLHYCWGVSKFCGVEAVIHTRELRPVSKNRKEYAYPRSNQYLTYFGAAADVEMAVYLSELIFLSLFDESDNYRQSQQYQEERVNGHHHRTLISSFRRAFVGRIGRRLSEARETIEQGWVDANTENKELMVQKDAHLRALFTSKYPRLASSRLLMSGASAVGSAQSAGRSAADRVNLGRPAGRDARLALEKLS